MLSIHYLTARGRLCNTRRLSICLFVC